MRIICYACHPPKKSIDYDRLAISRQFHRSDWLCQSGKRLVFKSYLIVIWFQWSLGLGEQDENLFFQKPKDPGWSGYSFSATYTPTNRWKPFLSNNYHTLYQTLFKEIKPRIYHSFPHPVKFDGTVVQYGTVVYSGIQWCSTQAPLNQLLARHWHAFRPWLSKSQSTAANPEVLEQRAQTEVSRLQQLIGMMIGGIWRGTSWISKTAGEVQIFLANLWLEPTFFGAKSKCQSNHSKEMGPKPWNSLLIGGKNGR